MVKPFKKTSVGCKAPQQCPHLSKGELAVLYRGVLDEGPTAPPAGRSCQANPRCMHGQERALQVGIGVCRWVRCTRRKKYTVLLGNLLSR